MVGIVSPVALHGLVSQPLQKSYLDNFRRFLIEADIDARDKFEDEQINPSPFFTSVESGKNVLKVTSGLALAVKQAVVRNFCDILVLHPTKLSLQELLDSLEVVLTDEEDAVVKDSCICSGDDSYDFKRDIEEQIFAYHEACVESLTEEFYVQLAAQNGLLASYLSEMLIRESVNYKNFEIKADLSSEIHLDKGHKLKSGVTNNDCDLRSALKKPLNYRAAQFVIDNNRYKTDQKLEDLYKAQTSRMYLICLSAYTICEEEAFEAAFQEALVELIGYDLKELNRRIVEKENPTFIIDPVKFVDTVQRNFLAKPIFELSKVTFRRNLYDAVIECSRENGWEIPDAYKLRGKG